MKYKKHLGGKGGITFYDPDKNIVSIGEAMEGVVNRLYKQGLSVDEIVSKTAMPNEFVEQVIKYELDQKEYFVDGINFSLCELKRFKFYLELGFDETNRTACSKKNL